MTCNRVSGKYGHFSVSGGTIAHLKNWNMSLNAPVTSEARSNTQGYQVSWGGVKSVSGGFSCAGAEPMVKILDTGVFRGHTGGMAPNTSGNNIAYAVRAAVSGVTMNFDWQAKTVSSDYQFVSDYQNSGDELQQTTGTISTDSSPPRSFLSPTTNPVLINGTPLCVQNATITFSATPNATSDSCSGGWQTLMGMGAVNVTFSGTCTCNDFSLIPDICTCNTLKIFTDMCDPTKFWEFSYFLMAGKDSLTVDTVSANGVTFTINMTYSIAPCGCDAATTGFIKDPNNVYWVGSAPA